jgi:hypothetical protein
LDERDYNNRNVLHQNSINFTGEDKSGSKPKRVSLTHTRKNTFDSKSKKHNTPQIKVKQK